MCDLNNASPTPSDDVKARTERKAAEMRKAMEECRAGEECQQPDPSAKKNDSIIAPEKSKEETLRGFHGG